MLNVLCFVSAFLLFGLVMELIGKHASQFLWNRERAALTLYRELLKDFPPAFESLNGLQTARELLATMEAREKLCEAERHYMEDLRRSIRMFEEERPWATFSNSEMEAMEGRLAEIESVRRQTEAIQRVHRVRYADAETLLESANHLTRFASRFLNDEMRPARDDRDLAQHYQFHRTNMAASLEIAAQQTERALELLELKRDGKILYGSSVSVLLESAAVAVNVHHCRDLLSAAFYRAEHPDAAAQPNDLALSLQGIALVTWKNSGRPAEAELLYRQALKAASNNVIRKYTLEDLAELCAEQGRIDEAVVLYKQAWETPLIDGAGAPTVPAPNFKELATKYATRGPRTETENAFARRWNSKLVFLGMLKHMI